jgi:multiple sugar transport system ATP-binding protein
MRQGKRFRPGAGAMTDIRYEGVRKDYFYKKKVLSAVRGLNLTCRQGEFLVFLGPSGCGKTTTLRLTAGLEDLTGGDIYFGQKRINHLPPANRNVAMAFENYALYPPLKIRDNITYSLKARKQNKKKIEDRLDIIAKTLEIEDLLDKKPKQISGGLQQLVSLARCMIKDADVYLMDEPLSHLDAEQRLRVRKELKAFHSKTGKTLIYVTHDQIEAITLADRIAVMNEGNLLQVAEPHVLYNQPQNMFVAGFIGEPPMNFIPGCIHYRSSSSDFVSTAQELKIPVLPEVLLNKDGLEPERSVVLGIRPESIVIDPTLNSASFKGNVVVYESLGESGIVEINCGSHNLVAITEAELQLKPGDVLRFCIDAEKIIVFDPETENRL